jgi:phospholipid transport system substrate-binding protein
LDLRRTMTLTRVAVATLTASLLALYAGSAAADQAAPAKVAVGEARGEARAEASVAEATSALATPQVEKLHVALIDIMQGADQYGYQGRYDHLAPTVTGTFDLPFMASKSVGRHWKSLDDSDKARWNEVFIRMITANYAGRFSAFSGEHFVTLGEEPAINDTRVVLTKLVIPDDDDVQLNYRLREVDGEWRIIDIYLNGTVSELALRRSEYSAVLKREGFEKLIDTLDDKVKELAKG